MASDRDAFFLETKGLTIFGFDPFRNFEERLIRPARRDLSSKFP